MAVVLRPVTATTVVLLVAFFSRNLVVPKGLPLRIGAGRSGPRHGGQCRDAPAGPAGFDAVAGQKLMSLYPAATVLLAIVVLREQVTRWQVLGMVLALAAVAMISVH